MPQFSGNYGESGGIKMINFDSLPNDKPYSVPKKGTYYATIQKAELKMPQDPNKKKPYLNLTLQLKTADGKSAGKIWDIISESDHDLIRYKLQRLITALEIPITGTFELKDLTKIIVNKSLIVDVTVEEKDGRPPKGVVDIFTNEIYYPLSKASEIFGSPNDVPFEINASDAADAQQLPFTETEDY
jgi:hypothetical protein